LNGNRTGKISRAKAVVIVAVVASILFGIYVAYLAWSYDSFPVTENPFGNYASVTSASFNGTEVSFNVKWLSGAYLPLKAQLTSVTSDVANSPTCWFDLKNVSSGQEIPMPFAIGQPTPVLKDLALYIAVKSTSDGSEFTIVYNLQSLSAQQGNISPSSYTCQQPSGQM